MADGYAARTGTPGVATVTMGPGLAQALPAVMTAARAGRSLVVITAQLPDTRPALAQFADQRAMTEAAGARYRLVEDAADLGAGLDAAFESARRRRPVVLAVALEVFETGRACDQVPQREEGAPEHPPDLDAAVAVLSAAKRPLVLLGAGVRASGSLVGALDLAGRIGAVVGTTVGGRAALGGDAQWDLGVLGMMANPTAREIAATADVVLVLGAALDRYNTDGTVLGRAARIVRVDQRPGESLWSPSSDTVNVTGDLAAVVPALRDALPALRRTGLRTGDVGEALRQESRRQAALAEIPTPDGPNPWAVVRELDAQLPPDAHVVTGIGHFWYFSAPYLRSTPDRTFHFACGFASIGQAIPVGVGAAAANGNRPVVVIEGDGSAVMNLQELQAAVRHGSDLLVVVLDNSAYGSEYHKLRLAGLDVAPSTFVDRPFDITAAANAMGATARAAATPDELRSALRDLVPLRGVRLVVARISAEQMSETYLRLHTASHSAASTLHDPTHDPSR
jgi:thiamine pyrophosphate-dependent acetolactate synthase large subunit-like protein